MALKKWKELAKIDVSKYVEKRQDEKGNEFDYIPWVAMLKLLHDNGAEEVSYGVIPSSTGHTVHMTDKEFTDKNGESNHCPEVHLWVKIDGKRYPDENEDSYYNYPIRSGSYVVKDKTMNQHRVDVAVTRGVCKLIAISTGLGISLWEKNDETDDSGSGLDVVEIQSVGNLLAKFGTTVRKIIDKGVSEAEIADRLGFDTDRVGDVIKAQLAPLRNEEKELAKMLKELSK